MENSLADRKHIIGRVNNIELWLELIRFKRPFKALIYYEYAYSRNRAVGMSYLNRFLIEEDTQFECVGVAEFRRYKVSEVSQYLKKTFESHFDQFSNKSNSDFIGHFILSGESLFSSGLMQVFEDISHMITQVGSERLECVQKEHYEKLTMKVAKSNTMK